MENANFFNVIQASYPTDTSKAFLTSPDFETCTYADAERISAAIAGLFNQLEIRPGARVVAQVSKSPMAVMLYLACLRSGVIYVPLNPAYTHDEVDYFLADTGPALFVCDPARREELDELFLKYAVPDILELDASGQGSLTARLADVSPQETPAFVEDEDIAVIIYTSGTTGKPKGAMLSHLNLRSNAETLYEFWGWRRDDVLIHALPVFHVHGLFVALHLALLGGSTIHFLARFNARQILDLLPDSTVLMGVPTFYTRLLHEEGLNPERCASMRLFISGSAPLLPETFEQFEARSGHRILERYGMSETGMIASNPLDGERLPGTVGYALPGVDVRIRDENNELVAAGEIGVLQVNGPNVFKGYWRKPELNQQDFVQGYFITGDLGSQDPDGRIRLAGRNKDLIISGGFNVYPKEVEDVLDRQPGIVESAVIGVPHPDYGEAVVAVAVCDSGFSGETDTITALRNHLAAYKVPKKILSLAELPRNTMGKVQKNRLREQFNSLFD